MSAMKKNDRCVNCGDMESLHHSFEPTLWPVKCQCDPDGWGFKTKPICKDYEENPKEGICNKCEHDLECHKA